MFWLVTRCRILPNGKSGMTRISARGKPPGSQNPTLLRTGDNPNEVIILFEASDLGKARAFASSADLRETTAVTEIRPC